MCAGNETILRQTLQETTYSIKNAIVDWLDPKPITYRADNQRLVEFQGYLPD